MVNYPNYFGSCPSCGRCHQCGDGPCYGASSDWIQAGTLQAGTYPGNTTGGNASVQAQAANNTANQQGQNNYNKL